MSLTQLRAAAPAKRLRAERLAEDNVKLTTWVVEKMYGLLPIHRDFSDAVAEATVALWRAALSWEPDRETRFGTYAVLAIRREVAKFLLRQNRRGLTHTGDGRNLRAPQPKTVVFSGEYGREWNDPPTVDHRGQGEGDGEEAHLLRFLTDRERTIIEEVVIADRDMADVGRELGICRERTRQIKQEALGRIRKRLEE